MGLIITPTITDGQTIDANDVMNITNPIVNEMNGNLDSYNIKDDSITQAKMADNSVGTAEIKDANVTMPKISNPYKFSATRITSDQTISTATWTTVALNGEDFDTNSNFDTATYKYTVPVTGYYFLTGQVYAGSADGIYSITCIVKNASSGITDGVILAEQRIVYVGNANKPNNCSCLVYLSAGDTLTLVAYIDDTTTPTVAYTTDTYRKTFLSGFLVSTT